MIEGRSRRPNPRWAAGAWTAAAVLALASAATIPAAAQEARTCAAAVQGEIAWNYEGETRWADRNVRRLCEGAESSVEPARCFDRVMHGGVDWGGGTRWAWANALALCAGTRDADATVACFERRVGDGQGWRGAIEACSGGAAPPEPDGEGPPDIPIPDDFPYVPPDRDGEGEGGVDEGAAAIRARHRELGGASGRLGRPEGAVRTNPRDSGKRRRYANGHIYWSPGTGAHVIYDGPIWEKWADQRWEQGELGYPVGDPRTNPDGTGRRQRFETGFIYWHPRTGAHVMHEGSIWDQWADQRWEQGELGYPMTDPLPNPAGGGHMQQFENGMLTGTVRTRPGVVVYRGDTDCRSTASGCSHCVADVERQFSRLGMLPGGNRSPSARIKIWARDARRLPPHPSDRLVCINNSGGGDHIQGFNRLPGRDHRWLIASVGAAGRADGGLVLAHMGASAPGRGGDRLVAAGRDRDAYNVNDPPGDREVRLFYPVGEDDDGSPSRSSGHPGGFQVVGDLVFVPYKAREDEEPYVDVWDVSEPEAAELVQTVELPAWNGEERGALYVAAERLASGGWILLVNRGDDGATTLLATDAATPGPDAEWRVLEEPDLGRFDGWYDGSCSGPVTRRFSMAYQNADFVRECGSGDLYLLAMRQNCVGWNADNSVHLFRVAGDEENGVRLEKRDAIHPDGEGNDWCELRGGGGVYTTPGNEMILYCSKGVSSGSCEGGGTLLKFSEHTVN